MYINFDELDTLEMENDKSIAPAAPAPIPCNSGRVSRGQSPMNFVFQQDLTNLAFSPRGQYRPDAVLSPEKDAFRSPYSLPVNLSVILPPALQPSWNGGRDRSMKRPSLRIPGYGPDEGSLTHEFECQVPSEPEMQSIDLANKCLANTTSEKLSQSFSGTSITGDSSGPPYGTPESSFSMNGPGSSLGHSPERRHSGRGSPGQWYLFPQEYTVLALSPRGVYHPDDEIVVPCNPSQRLTSLSPSLGLASPLRNGGKDSKTPSPFLERDAPQGVASGPLEESRAAARSPSEWSVQLRTLSGYSVEDIYEHRCLGRDPSIESLRYKADHDTAGSRPDPVAADAINIDKSGQSSTWYDPPDHLSGLTLSPASTAIPKVTRAARAKPSTEQQSYLDWRFGSSRECCVIA